MRNTPRSNPLKTVREYLLMTAGLLIYSFGWIACIKPMEVAAGGGTGLSMILSHTAAELWGIDIRIGTVFLAINAFLLLVSGVTVGWNFGFRTLFCIIVASGFMSVMEPYFMTHYPPAGDVLGLDDKLLTIILGGLLAGAGMAVCFTAGGATGGTDIVAKIVHKYWGVAYGKVIIYSDILIIGSTLLVGYGLADVVYGYIVTVVVGTTVDLLMAGSQQSNQIFIVTADYDRMADAMLHEADRGVTLIDATGGYSRHDIRIVMVVCYKRDAGHILRLARDIDPRAFVTIASVSGTYGEGFRKLTQLR
ncbi:YitT family protein [Alistipes sp.]|uniref:YitT family protein n=1 Tax=Alistipes sp. TaxID=1872444 RepID=UPI003A839C28